MKTRTLFLLFFLLMACCKLFAQIPSCAITTFQKIYGKASIQDLAMDIVETPDHGFITGGWGADNQDCFLMKIDNKGNIVWLRQITDYGRVRGHMKRFIRLKDGNYVAAGRAYAPDFLDTWVIKFDENGNIIWNKEITYPTGISNDAFNLCETSDGGLAISCTYSPYANAGGVLIVKLNQTGNIVWSKVHLNDIFLPGMTEKNGILYLAGVNESADGVVIKMRSSDGSVLSGVSMHIDNKYTRFHGIEEKNNKLYIDAYNTDNQSFDGLHQVIVIADTNLNVLKVHKFKFNFKHEWEIPAMFPVEDGGFVAAECDDLNADLLLFKVSYDGVIKWQRKYPRPGDQRTYNIKQTSDKGIIGVGVSNNYGNYYNYQNDIYIFKTDSLGLTPDCSVTDPNASISNPAITSYSTIFSFNDLAFPVISINSQSVPVTIPVTVLCEKTVLPACNTLKIAGSDTVCHLSDTLLYKAVRNNCNAPVNWSIDTTQATIISTTDSTLKVKFKKAGTAKIISAITNSCQSLSDSLTIQVFNSPNTIDLGPDASLCPNNTDTLHAGPGFKTYRWQDGSTDSIFVVTQPGLYYVTTTDACGSVYNDSVSVKAAPPIPFYAGPDRMKCNNDTLHLSAPPGFLSYAWSNNYNINYTTAQTVIVNPLVDITYYVRAEKIPGCFAYDTIHITVHHSPLIDLGADKIFCSGDSAILDAGGGFQSYQWSNGVKTQQIVVKAVGDYSVTGTSTEGCKSFDTVKVLAVYALPVIHLDKDPGICFGAGRTLDAGRFSAYLWNTGDTTSTITVNRTGGYSVAVTDLHGCKASDTTYITKFYPLPAGFLTPDTAICSYGTIELKPLSSYNHYLWSTGSMNSSVSVSQPGVYWLEVIDANGCKGKDTTAVHSKDCMSGLYVPTAFTPNGDGRNDTFHPLLYGNVKQYRFTVYNRWGQVVFYTTEPQKGWNGKVAGVLQDSNVFVWTCTYQLAGEEVKMQKGTVTILR